MKLEYFNLKNSLEVKKTLELITNLLSVIRLSILYYIFHNRYFKSYIELI